MTFLRTFITFLKKMKYSSRNEVHDPLFDQFLLIHTAQHSTKALIPIKEREQYIADAQKIFKEDNITHIRHKKYNSVADIDIDELIDKKYLDERSGAIQIQSFGEFAESFHESFRDSYSEVMVNVGNDHLGNYTIYTSPSHMDALEKRMKSEPKSMPRAANTTGTVGRIKPSAGVSFERRKASALQGDEDLADFSIIRF